MTITRKALPQNYITKNGTIITDFSDISKFSIAAGTASQNANGGIDITSGTAGGISRLDLPFSPSIDFSLIDNITLEVDNVSNFSGTGAACFLYLTSNNFSGSKYVVKSPYQTFIRAGKNTLKFQVGDALLSTGWTYSGGESFNNPMNKLRLAWQAPTGQILSATYKKLTLNMKSIPKVIFAFDDGYKGIYDYAYPILANSGFKGSCFVIPSLVESVDVNYMRLSHLQTLYNAGWDICNHTYHHYGTVDNNLTTVSSDVCTSEIQTARDWLINNGFTRSAHYFAYPGGYYNDSVVSIVKSLGVKLARSTNSAFDYMPLEDIYRLKWLSVGSASTIFTNTPATDIQQYIYEAIKTGSTLIISCHNMNTDGANGATINTFYQKVVDYIKQLGVDVVTFNEWYNGLTNPRKLIA